MKQPQRTLIIPTNLVSTAMIGAPSYAAVGISGSDDDQIITLQPFEILVAGNVSLQLLTTGVEAVPLDPTSVIGRTGTLLFDQASVLAQAGDSATTEEGVTVTLLEIGSPANPAGQGYQFDACVSFTAEQTVELTKHPIETGARITDHVIVNPRTYRLECIVSNTPIGNLAAFTGGVDLAASKRAEIFYANFLQLVRDATVVTVVHPLIASVASKQTDSSALIVAKDSGTFIVTSVSSPKTADTGGSVILNITLEEVVIVSSKLSTIPKSLLVRKDSIKDKGVTDAFATTPEERRKASFAESLLDDDPDEPVPENTP